MDNLFFKLLTLSFSASIITLVILVLRPFLKKAPRWIHCALWALVALRLLCPFSFESRLSLMPEPPVSALVAEVPEQIPQPMPEPQVQQAPPRTEASPQPVPAPAPLPAAPKAKPSPLTVLELLWLLGALSMGIYWAISYQKLHRKVSPAVEIRRGVFLCDYIDTPFVLGILKPRIYLPGHLAPGDLPYILAHEQAHIQRRDPWWKVLAALLLTLHWFNPILWAAFLLFCRDMESACDEKVIRSMGDPAKVPYSQTLLNCSLPRARIYPLAFGEIGVKQRITQVLHYRKPAMWITLAALLALGITGLCLLTNRPVGLSALNPLEPQSPVTLLGAHMAYSMETPQEQNAVDDFLHSLSYDPEPLEQGPGHEDPGTLILSGSLFDSANSVTFSPDGSQVTVIEDSAVQGSFRIRNPRKVLSFFQLWLDPFGKQPVSGRPQWDPEKPWVWTRSLERENLEGIHSSTRIVYSPDPDSPGISHRGGQSGGYYNGPYVKPLLDLLHGLKPEQFLPGQEVVTANLSSLGEPSAADLPCTTLSIYDPGNQSIGVLRLEGEQLDFYLSERPDDYETLRMDRSGGQGSYFLHWQLESPELLTFLQEQQEFSPTVDTFVGWEYDWALPREMSHGDALITLNAISSWEVREVPYQDEETAWGYRIRPRDVSEGWIFFGFWPQGFSLEEEDRYYAESGYADFDRVITSYPGSVAGDGYLDLSQAVWSYQLFEGPVGTYVILSEGADSWMADYRDALEDTITLSSFQGYAPILDENGEPLPRTYVWDWIQALSLEDNSSLALRFHGTAADLPVDPMHPAEGTGHISARLLSPLLDLIVTLEPGDFAALEPMEGETLETLCEQEGRGWMRTALMLPDPSQELVFVFLLTEDPNAEDPAVLELLLSQDYEGLSRDSFCKSDFTHWRIFDRQLIREFQRLAAFQWRHTWEPPVSMENDGRKLSLMTLPGWKIQEVPYENAESPWGFRVRPADATEGWLFFSFWPQGYEPGDTIYSEAYQLGFESLRIGYENRQNIYDPEGNLLPDALWNYQRFRTDLGDYAVLNENADSWLAPHFREVQDMILLFTFRKTP